MFSGFMRLGFDLKGEPEGSKASGKSFGGDSSEDSTKDGRAVGLLSRVFADHHEVDFHAWDTS